MTGDVTATLDALKQSPDPAWLWDAERRRVAWANPAGLALWGAETALDLIERRFPASDPGVEKLAETFRATAADALATVRLAFAGLEAAAPLECRCRRHVLGDGRPGLLVVAMAGTGEPGADAAAAGALDALACPVAVLDGHGAITFTNAAARDLWSARPPATLGDIVGSADAADDLLRQARDTGLVSRIADLAPPLGNRPHRLHLEPQPHAGGDAQRFVVQFDDVGDRRAIEHELRADIDRLADFVAAAATITWELDADLRFAAADGDVPDDLVGTLWTEFAAAHRLDPGGAIARALAARDAWRTDVAWPWPDGTRQTYLSALPYFDRDGGFAGFRGVGAARVPGSAPAPPPEPGDARSAEATAHRSAAEEARLSAEDTAAFRQIGEKLSDEDGAGDGAGDVGAEPGVAGDPAVVAKPDAADDGARPGPSDDDLRTILDTATDGVLTLDDRGRIASLNASAQAIFGYDTQEAIGRPIYDFLTADSAETVRDYLSALTDSGLARIFNDGREIVAVEKQGGEIPLFVTIGRIYAGGQRRSGYSGYCAVIRDITQWKRAETELRSAKDQAERANAQKSEFLASISHELRTPLNAIIGFSEVMKTEKFGTISNDRYKGYVTDIHASGEHLLSLINDLLDLSKVEAGKLELNFTSVDLSDIIQQCIGIVQEHATRERIIIRTSVADRLPNVVADQRSIRQILLNLLSNAVKYTDQGGQVIVSALMDEDGQVKLRVKDTGVGMSSDELVQAMQPFQRVERTQRSEKPGTGLGLPLTKALAEANRASFEIESEPGRGTRVQVTFPTTRVLAD